MDESPDFKVALPADSDLPSPNDGPATAAPSPVKAPTPPPAQRVVGTTGKGPAAPASTGATQPRSRRANSKTMAAMHSAVLPRQCDVRLEESLTVKPRLRQTPEGAEGDGRTRRGTGANRYSLAPTRPGPSTTERTAGPRFRLTHPQGFRLLKPTSVIERSMRGYFRLPQMPTAHLLEERRRVNKQLEELERQETAAARALGANGGLVLDGFLLLSTAGTEDPEEVEAVTLKESHLVSSVPEDLAFFPNLCFLDVSENRLSLEALAELTGLQTLHMAYNRITSLLGLGEILLDRQSAAEAAAAAAAQPEGGSGENASGAADDRERALETSAATADMLFPNLVALNLSYNTIPSDELLLLCYLPCLEQLDLSGNRLTQLPPDLSALASVTRLALEGNRLAGDDVFLSLATMPALVEVNLNRNNLARVPPLDVRDGSGLCFPSTEVISLSHNRFGAAADVIELAPLHRTLRSVVLSETPLASLRAERDAAVLGFDRHVVDTYYERHAGGSDDDDERSRGPRGGEEAAAAPEVGAGDPADAGAAAREMAPGVEGIDEDAGDGSQDDDDDDGWEGEGWSRLLPLRHDEEGGEECEEPPLDVSQAAAAAAAAAAESAREGDAAALPGGGGARDLYGSAEEYLRAHHVELYFDRSEMPKRKQRDFCGGRTREERAELVTIPQQAEFMDIYRITESDQARRRQYQRWDRTHPRGQKKSAASTGIVARPATPPPDSSEDDESYEEDEEELSEEEEEQEAQPHTRDHEDGGAFFITGVDGADESKPKRKGRGEKDGAEADNNKSRKKKKRKADKEGEGEPSAFKTRSAPAAAAAASAPEVVISPATANVHTAMTELRAMLRRPLPALPYVTGTKPGNPAATGKSASRYY